MADLSDPVEVSALDPEDAKIVTLARASRARIGAAAGAAVRDTGGRTYTAATVALPSLALTALQAAVAAAAAAGSDGLEAAAVVAEEPDPADPGVAAAREMTAGAPVAFTDPEAARVRWLA